MSKIVASQTPPPTVFVSYASEDREAARLIGNALVQAGLEVWFDESELGGGDSWDQKIRAQIRECDFFLALVSAQTEARHEGYFRREWRLAVERTLDMADDHPFLLPIVIDDTDQSGARVPEKFLAVQWLKIPGGRATPGLEALCRRMLSGASAAPAFSKKPRRRPGSDAIAAAPRPSAPEFPRQEPGQPLRFGVQVVGWALRSAWTLFTRLPRWLRIVAVIWLGIWLLSRQNTSPNPHHSTELSPAAAQKLKLISEQYHQGGPNKTDAAQLGANIAREFSGVIPQGAPEHSPLLAIPFAAPAGDAAAQRLADSAFAEVYGRLALAHHSPLRSAQDPLPACERQAAQTRGRAAGATYVLCGEVGTAASVRALSVSLVKVSDTALLWSKSYPAAGADPAKIAADVQAHLPSVDEE